MINVLSAYRPVAMPLVMRLLLVGVLLPMRLSAIPSEKFAQAVFSPALLTKIEHLDYGVNDIGSVELIPLSQRVREELMREYFRFNERGWATNADHKALKTVAPFFPREERALRVTDVVEGLVVVAKDGGIREVYVKFSRENFGRAAALGLRSWKFPEASSDYLVVVQVPFLFEDVPSKPVLTNVVCSHPEIRLELLRFQQADQEIRRQQIHHPVSPDSEIESAMQNLDSANSDRLKAIVREIGWPTAASVGDDGAQAAFVILQHSPELAFQKSMLPHIRHETINRRLPIECYALLQDRILVRERKPQIYGSQAKPVTEWKDGIPVLEPIEDEANVDKRRAELGLDPLTFYLQNLRDQYTLNR